MGPPRYICTTETGDGVTSEPNNTVWVGTGRDGAITISADTNINTTDSISGRTCSDTTGGDAVIYTSNDNIAAGDTTIDLVETPSTPSCLAVGDELIIFNAKGTSTATGDGRYEFVRVSSISSNVITLNRELENAYNGTNREIMVQRVPNYSDVTISNSGTDFTPSVWDGVTNMRGGVMAFRANGTVSVATGATINANAAGYAGGAAGTAGANGGGGGGGHGFGGGGGGSAQGSAAGTAGAAGGGVVYVQGVTISNSGTISANGGNGNAATTQYAGGGGAGAGGSVIVGAINDTLGTVTATGGSAASNAGTDRTGAGAGGDGRVYFRYTDASAPTATPTAGSNRLPFVSSLGSELSYSQISFTANYGFNEGFGTSTNSVQAANSGQSNASVSATISGAVWQSEELCIVSKCLFFDGVDDMVTATNPIEGVKSVSFWVRPMSTT
ncbi:MAG: hypothetical protein KatS3mg087_0999 [Patescibacteria group bacterium]|nr:MAG: hypothetical protein KatS3mg087_0999 [Patescibacteria group bacterium]